MSSLDRIPNHILATTTHTIKTTLKSLEGEEATKEGIFHAGGIRTMTTARVLLILIVSKRTTIEETTTDNLIHHHEPTNHQTVTTAGTVSRSLRDFQKMRHIVLAVLL